MEKAKIAAVVVTFNRKQLLLECLKALENQTYPLDAIYIIDGPSTDGTTESLLENNYINELPPMRYHGYSWNTVNILSGRAYKKLSIYYVRIYDDIGGSGGFHEGVKHAYKNGYNWIWLMDDDAEPMDNALEELIKHIDLPDAIVLASTVKEITGGISQSHRGAFSFNKCFPSIQRPLDNVKYRYNYPIKIDFASFVGPLIKSNAVREIGYPNKNFFIHHDDVEYCLRLSKIGQIYLVPSSIIVHKEKSTQLNAVRKGVFGINMHRTPYNKLWKTYYGRRNLVYLGDKHSANKIRFLIDLFRSWILNVLAITFFDDNKLKRIRFMNSAYIDGLRGIFDNEKPKRILYGEK